MFLNLMETFHPGGLPISLDFLCFQWEKSSCLEFKVDFSGHMTIVNFSLVHSLQNSVTGLRFLMFFLKF